jgi:hypothetical protein
MQLEMQALLDPSLKGYESLELLMISIHSAAFCNIFATLIRRFLTGVNVFAEHSESV